MAVQPNAPISISGDVDRSPWQLLDMIALGNRTLALTAPIPLSQAVARLGALAESEPSDPDMPFLTLKVNGNRVEAEYSMPQNASSSPFDYENVGILGMVRPVYRGYLSGDEDGVQLQGWFGVNDVTRFFGFVSAVLVVALILAGVLHVPLGIGIVAWIVPAVFIALCLITRANGDDLDYIAKNLEYALQGDPGS
jgi:hypothetical protein